VGAASTRLTSRPGAHARPRPQYQPMGPRKRPGRCPHSVHLQENFRRRRVGICPAAGARGCRGVRRPSEYRLLTLLAPSDTGGHAYLFVGAEEAGHAGMLVGTQEAADEHEAIEKAPTRSKRAKADGRAARLVESQLR
jgi:hypothetical protein